MARAWLTVIVTVALTLWLAFTAGPLAPPRPRAAPTDTLRPRVDECASPRPDWIWCDDFESDRLGRYFEYDSAHGRFARTAGAGVGGSYAMTARFDSGTVNAGALHLAFGRTPSRYFRTVDAGTATYRDVYWRVYLRNEPGWSGGGGFKMTRATSFAAANWAQAMIVHVWSGKSSGDRLAIDPASGTDASGALRTTKYNDFAHLRWLGAARSAEPLFDAAHVGAWHCVEAHARLNAPGRADGEAELWVDGAPAARRVGLDFVGRADAYGINAVLLENYWNGGAPRAQSRAFDNLVVATRPVGCR